MLVKGLADAKETFFGIGEVSIKKGEVKEIPDAVFKLWTNKVRNNVLVEKYVEPKEEKPEKSEQEEKPKQTRRQRTSK